MRSVLYVWLATGLLAGVALGQEQTANTPAAGSSLPASTEPVKPKKPKAKHVYTNEDIPERPAEAAGTVSSAGSGNGEQAKADGKGNAKADPKGAKKAASPEAVEAANAKVEKLKQEETTATSAMQSLEKMISEGGEYRKNTMGDSLQQLKVKLEQIKTQRATAESDLEKLKGK